MEMAKKTKDAARLSGRLPSIRADRQPYLGPLHKDNNSYVLLHSVGFIRPPADRLKCCAIILAGRRTADRIGG
jgi:hypothetical protein